MVSLAKFWFQKSRIAIHQVVLSKKLFSLWWGYALVLLLNVMAYPLLTSWYGPEQFGELAIYSNTVLVLAGVGALCFDKAIVVAKSKARATNLLYLSCFILLLSCVFAGGLLWAFNDTISRLLQLSTGLQIWWGLLPFIFLAAGAFQIGSAWLLRQGAFQELSRFRLLQRAGTLAVQLLLVIFLGARYGLIIGFIAGFLLVFAALLIRFLQSGLHFRPSFSFAKQSWQRFSDFPSYLFPQTFLDRFSSRLPFLLLPALFGMEAAGYFSVAYALLSLPEALLSTAVGEVFFQKISSASHKEIKKQLESYCLVLFLIGIVPFALLFFFGESILVALLGVEWQTTGSLLSLMAPMFLFTFIGTPISKTLMVMRKQQYNFYFGLASLLIRPALLYLGFILGSVFQAIALWVIFEIVQILVYLLLVYHFTHQNDRDC